MPLEYGEEDGFRPVRRWKTVALSHVVELVDLGVKKNGSKRRRR